MDKIEILNQIGRIRSDLEEDAFTTVADCKKAIIQILIILSKII